MKIFATCVSKSIAGTPDRQGYTPSEFRGVKFKGYANDKFNDFEFFAPLTVAESEEYELGKEYELVIKTDGS